MATVEVMRSAAPGTVATIAGAEKRVSAGFGMIMGVHVTHPRAIAVDPSFAACVIFNCTSGNHPFALRLDLATGVLAEIESLSNFTVDSACVSPCGRALVLGTDEGVAWYSLESQQLTTIVKAPERESPGALSKVSGLCSVDARMAAIDRSGNALFLLALHGDAPADVTLLAGSGVEGCVDGVGQAARFMFPSSVALALDPAFLFIGEFAAIRVVQLATAAVRTLAGGETRGYCDGLATAAQFSGVYGLAVAPCGTLFASDGGNERIRAVTALGGVTTLAGTGAIGCVDGPFADAMFYTPLNLALAPDGGLLVADLRNSRIRYLAGVYVTPQRFALQTEQRQTETERRKTETEDGAGNLPVPLQRVVQTLAVLWDGRSERLTALAVPGIRRANYLHIERLVYLLQWVQGALWAAAVTPVFEDLPLRVRQ
eukprot:c20759_g3_i2.p1 GENE.c20759_g3_i2~~c20759_g3_i2.p1  ORF type:complete len:436 (+),score=59.71 c20759_g3_i2:22-1308(+)